MTQNPSSRFHAVIVLQREAEFARACVAAALAQTFPFRQVTLVDQLAALDPDDTTGRDLAAAFPEIRLMRPPQPLSFAACCNRAAAGCRDIDFLLLLDPDSVLSMTALQKLVEAFAAMPAAAVMGCKVLGGDVETIQHLGSTMRGNGMPSHFGFGELDEGQYSGVRDALSVQAAALAVRAEVWCELGGLDESFWPDYFEIADFCFRARTALWRVAVACEATATHFGLMAPDGLDVAGKRLFFQNRVRFLRKHYRVGEWLTRFAPDELRWLFNGASKDMKTLALSATLRGFFDDRPSLPQTVQ